MTNKRYKHILVPLDGSKLAEVALIDALAIAKLSQAEVTMLQVITPVESVVEVSAAQYSYADKVLENKLELAEQYLNSICDRIACETITTHSVVEIGTAAETIIDYAHRQPIDLIVMATHGRSGLQRWVYGSVANKVLRGADLPILLVRAHSQ